MLVIILYLMEGKLRSLRCTHLESKQTSCCNLLLHLTTYGLFPLLVAWSPYINPLLATWDWKLLNFGRWVPPFCNHFWLVSRIMWESHMHLKMCTWWPTCSMKSVVLRFSDICGWPSVSFDSLPVSHTVFFIFSFVYAAYLYRVLVTDVNWFQKAGD